MRILEIKRGESPELRDIGNEIEDMQQEVGGFIEAIYPFDDAIAIVCNEEGKLAGLPVSRFLLYQDTVYCDAICGTFFICGLGEEDFVDIPSELVDKYKAMFEPDIVKI